ncbi:hypothetical protein BVC80_1449g1 [Macleaya cordata]|uniref:Uncharacterized protein n=1 Tax=Macleaya cordata TaxID=56857 RepID=A0A200RBC2_MACCD|nr:hypothetical protein BVC80_1449g1 [Macleaya cordata]
MATRTAARYVSQRLSSGARNLIEKENSAENIYIKKIELERLQKLASKAKTSSNKIHYLRREFWNLSKECKKLENELVCPSILSC